MYNYNYSDIKSQKHFKNHKKKKKLLESSVQQIVSDAKNNDKSM